MLDVVRRDIHQPWRDAPIGALGLAKYTMNKMKHMRIETVGELLVRSIGEIGPFGGVGEKTIKDIVWRLSRHQMFLREDIRSKADALRYTYDIVGTAPASTILPLRNAHAWKAFGRDGGLFSFPRLRTIGDFYDIDLETFDRFLNFSSGNVKLNPEEQKDLVRVLTEINFLKGYSIFLETKENSKSLENLPE